MQQLIFDVENLDTSIFVSACEYFSTVYAEHFIYKIIPPKLTDEKTKILVLSDDPRIFYQLGLRVGNDLMEKNKTPKL